MPCARGRQFPQLYGGGRKSPPPFQALVRGRNHGGADMIVHWACLLLAIALLATGHLQPGLESSEECVPVLGAFPASSPKSTNWLWRTTMAEDVIAQVVLRSPDGSSILDATQPITAETIARYRVGEEVVRRASGALERLGFKVLAPGPTGFTISGSRALFEQVFDTVLQESADRGQSALEPGKVQPRFVPLRPLRIPDELSPLIAAVVMPVPMQLMP